MKLNILLVFLLIGTVLGDDVEFEFHAYRMDPKIGQALEDRLIAGGDAALGAMSKMPDFILQKRVTELDSISISASLEKRVRETAGDSVISLPFHEAVDGLEMEVELLSNTESIDFYYYGSYTSKMRDKPIERTVTSQTRARDGIPVLLCRWQMEKDWILLVGKATGEVTQPDGIINNVLYIESAYYPSATSAKSKRDLLASTRIPCVNGKPGWAKMISWIDDENILESDQPGFRVDLDPALYDDGSMQLATKCSYIIESGGRTRLENGDRVRRLKIREVAETLEMKEGELAGRKSKLAALEDIETKEDNYVATFKFVLPPAN